MFVFHWFLLVFGTPGDLGSLGEAGESKIHGFPLFFNVLGGRGTADCNIWRGRGRRKKNNDLSFRSGGGGAAGAPGGAGESLGAPGWCVWYAWCVWGMWCVCVCVCGVCLWCVWCCVCLCVVCVCGVEIKLSEL